jgi:hypothetical protein
MPDSLDQLGRQLFLVGHVVVVAAVDDLGHLVLQGGTSLGWLWPSVLTAMPASASR